MYSNLKRTHYEENNFIGSFCFNGHNCICTTGLWLRDQGRTKLRCQWRLFPIGGKRPKSNVGYHIGVFGKLGDKIYFRPELVYTKMKSDYDNSSFDMSKLDAPLLVGVNIIGPLQVFAGPALQYILDTDFENVSIGDAKNDFSVGLNIGAGVSFGKFGIDLRYERGFNKNEITILDNNNVPIGDRIDTRPDQLILSLGLRL